MRTTAALVRAKGTVTEVNPRSGHGQIFCAPLGGSIKFRAAEVRNGARLVAQDQVEFNVKFAGARAVAADVCLVSLSPQRRLVAHSFEAAAAALRAARSTPAFRMRRQ